MFGTIVTNLWARPLARQVLRIWWPIAIALGLSGCVNYQTGIVFHSLNYGEIVEHIQLGEQLKSFSQTAVNTWLESIEQRTNQAHGRIERTSDRDLTAIIPFYNARDLTTKIERFFNPQLNPNYQQPQFASHLQVNQNNFFVVVRNHLTCDIDLRSLTPTANPQQAAIPTKNAVQLDFSLRSPWGVTEHSAGNPIATRTSDGRQLNWQLQPGKIDHIDAVFWLPNPLAIGAIAIVLLGLGGYYLKYRQLPWQQPSL